MAGPAEIAAMRRALLLAARGVGRTNPNPPVGCVVLDATGRSVAEGWHERAGGPHAEIRALTAAGAGAAGGTAVVTLEPCRHTGRTGPCTAALRAAGVRRVVFAVADPDPAHAGAGELRAAGLDVEGGVLADEGAHLLARWLFAERSGRPHVTWKFAATLDGRVAAADGSSRWITSAAARADAHRLRAEADAVVVGVGTVLADDPQLAVRLPDWPRQPVRVVVDGTARTPPGARVLDGSQPTVLAVGADADPERIKALRATPTEVVELPAPDGRVELAALLPALYQRELRQLLLEGGPTLAASFVSGGLVDRVVGYLAPALLGSGAPVLAGLGIDTLAGALQLTVRDLRTCGPDIRVEGRVGSAEG